MLKVRARRFFCDDPGCERLPEVAAHARKAARLEGALLAIILELGGRAGARLAAELGLLVGRDALLSRAGRAAPSGAEKVRVLGIDDFAFRKGNAYGTILVDLERRKVVDLSPGSVRAYVLGLAAGTLGLRGHRPRPGSPRRPRR